MVPKLERQGDLTVPLEATGLPYRRFLAEIERPEECASRECPGSDLRGRVGDSPLSISSASVGVVYGVS